MNEQLTLVLNRGEAGTVIDALIEHAASARRRKSVNVASSSDVRAEACERLIRQLNREAAVDRETQIRLGVEDYQGASATK